ncbi:MAG: DUF4190 domain-containing protein [Acidobacteriota bacterium]
MLFIPVLLWGIADMSNYYCPNCGALNPTSVTACYNCGAPNPTAQATDATPSAATNPFEAPTQPQSPYLASSYPPPVPPSAYGMPPDSYRSPVTSPPPYVPPAPYMPPMYGPVGYQDLVSSTETLRWKRQAQTSLILGIVGLLCCGLLGPIALGLGIQSKNGLRRLGVTDGQSMATVGIVLGGVATALWFLAILISLIFG